MIRSERVRERLELSGLSQSELARRVGVTQGAIAKLVSKNPGGSSHLHRIARVLGTTPAYLEGETDDPDAGAPPPPLQPAIQQIMMPVSLPSEEALTSAFAAMLEASRGMSEDELARELAKRLPMLLRVARAALPVQQSDDDEVPHEPLPAPAVDRLAKRQARHNT